MIVVVVLLPCTAMRYYDSLLNHSFIYLIIHLFTLFYFCSAISYLSIYFELLLQFASIMTKSIYNVSIICTVIIHFLMLLNSFLMLLRFYETIARSCLMDMYVQYECYFSTWPCYYVCVYVNKKLTN